MHAGGYVPDEVTNAIVRGPARASRTPPSGFLLDGYPRTAAQVAELDAHARGARARARRGPRARPSTRTRSSQRLLKRAETEGRADDTEDVIRAPPGRSTARRPHRSRSSTRDARPAAPGRRHGRRRRGRPTRLAARRIDGALRRDRAVMFGRRPAPDQDPRADPRSCARPGWSSGETLELLRERAAARRDDRRAGRHRRGATSAATAATPSFLGYHGFTGTLCISVNDEVVHGIPGPRGLVEGDLVSIDCGAIVDGLARRRGRHRRRRRPGGRRPRTTWR